MKDPELELPHMADGGGHQAAAAAVERTTQPPAKRPKIAGKR